MPPSPLPGEFPAGQSQLNPKLSDNNCLCFDANHGSNCPNGDRNNQQQMAVASLQPESTVVMNRPHTQGNIFTIGGPKGTVQGGRNRRYDSQAAT